MGDIGNDLRRFREEIEELRSFRTVQRLPKQYKKRVDPMGLDDVEFRYKYRFTKENMKKIINLVKEELEVDKRGGGISPDLQVMSAIRYWGRHEVCTYCILLRSQKVDLFI